MSAASRKRERERAEKYESGGIREAMVFHWEMKRGRDQETAGKPDTDTATKRRAKTRTLYERLRRIQKSAYDSSVKDRSAHGSQDASGNAG